MSDSNSFFQKKRNIILKLVLILFNECVVWKTFISLNGIKLFCTRIILINYSIFSICNSIPAFIVF
jgi:hypothetical protein